MKDQEGRLTHLREDGSAAMVDVSGKDISRREAQAEGFIRLRRETLAAIGAGEMPKGDVLAVARVAGIQGAKQTPGLIPLCHPLPLTRVAIDFELKPDGICVVCQARTDARTGVEMEALTGVTVAALTLYDMCKAIDPEMEIGGIRLVSKTKTPL